MEYEFSDNQKVFIADAEDAGYEVDYTYSGRGMFGAKCPAVRLDFGEHFNSDSKYKTDSMGRGTVVYAEY